MESAYCALLHYNQLVLDLAMYGILLWLQLGLAFRALPIRVFFQSVLFILF